MSECELSECDEIQVCVENFSNDDEQQRTVSVIKEFPPPRVMFSNQSRSVKLNSDGNLKIDVENAASHSDSSSSDSSDDSHSDLSSIDSSDESSSSSSSSSSVDSSSVDSSSSSESSEDEVINPIFISDGIVGDLDCNGITTKVFPGKSVNYITSAVKKQFQQLNRHIWLSVGNFAVINLPKSLGTVIQRNEYRMKLRSSFENSLTQFNEIIKSKGGRLFVIEVFPSPSVLDPNRSTHSSQAYQKLGWKLFLDFNKVIKQLNSQNGNHGTVNASSYLRTPVKLDKQGKRRYVHKSCMAISSDEEGNGPKRVTYESKIKLNLHQTDNHHLLEPIRLVVANVVERAIRKNLN